jgi:peptidoglycan/xylan/chitin deacetylase (PgdA/CDA1 family)
MSTAYLTIDDGPTRNTKQYLDFLLDKGIIPVMFFWGDRIKEARENGIYAIQHGAIIGNHTDTHPHFSSIPLKQCIEEIERQEEAINSLYEEAGVKREYKLFRFPYGDKGGENKEALQEYLKSHGFCKLDYRPITYDWYYGSKLDRDYDTLWTFDFEEYRLQYDNSFSYDMILDRIDLVNPKNGGSLPDPNAHNILLIHDHPQTDAIVPGYFTNLINRAIKAGVTFVKPKFISE